MAELAEHGCDSARGREALRVVNRVHGRYVIANEDMLFVLASFVYEPIDWIDAYGWRPLHAHERLAAFHHYRDVGRRMGITGDPGRLRRVPGVQDRVRAGALPRTARQQPADRDGDTMELFCSWYPAPLRPLVAAGAAGAAAGADADRVRLRAPRRPGIAPRWCGRRCGRGRALVRTLPPRRLLEARLGAAQPDVPAAIRPAGRPADLGAPPPPPDLDPAAAAPLNPDDRRARTRRVILEG